jgi:hypothetical protein
LKKVNLSEEWREMFKHLADKLTDRKK